MVTPVARREALALLKNKGLSERAACRMTGVSRQVGSYELKQPDKDRILTASLVEASSRYPRFGYRRIAVMTCQSASRVWRLWNRLGLNLPKRRPRKRRCGTDIRIPGATRPNNVWSYDFVHDRLANGNPLKLLCVLDEHTRECLAIEVGKSLRSQDVILTLSRLMRLYETSIYSIRQWSGIYRHSSNEMAARPECWTGLHQTGQPFVEASCEMPSRMVHNATRGMIEMAARVYVTHRHRQLGTY
ncbi:hypothetical protein NNRS527_00030 [Nitrosospira sp. NRS527]|nr:hypothetical protein NNRS527_00030 [Nitrosospira sp. NRS527]